MMLAVVIMWPTFIPHVRHVMIPEPVPFADEDRKMQLKAKLRDYFVTHMFWYWYQNWGVVLAPILKNFEQFEALLTYLKGLPTRWSSLKSPTLARLTWDVKAAQASSWKQNLTPLLVLSSDKSQCFDSVGPLNVIHGSPFTPHNK